MVEGYAVGGVRSDFFRPFNDGTLLGFNGTTNMFALYDEYAPMEKTLLGSVSGS